MEILKYKDEFKNDIFATISKDPEWCKFTKADALEAYEHCLTNGITYVCYNNDDFCGYVRAVLDKGFAIYISELYVKPKWRNLGIGQCLIEKVKHDFSSLSVYALSDEDGYYIGRGYTKEGSVFQI